VLLPCYRGAVRSALQLRLTGLAGASLYHVWRESTPPVDEIFMPARRAFLSQLTAMAALGACAAVVARAGGERRLSFVHTHTGERLSTVYFRDGNYLPAELERINHLLRDFRTGDVHAIDPGVLDILTDLRGLCDRDTPYEVISGYRSPATNAALRSRSHSAGVAEHSLHMQGRAVDVRLEGFLTARLHELALGLHRGGVGFYPRSDFVHIDNGRVRCWSG
jgi:uncharacterized protein YcbK (DUF882 family)